MGQPQGRALSNEAAREAMSIALAALADCRTALTEAEAGILILQTTIKAA